MHARFPAYLGLAKSFLFHSAGAAPLTLDVHMAHDMFPDIQKAHAHNDNATWDAMCLVSIAYLHNEKNNEEKQLSAIALLGPAPYPKNDCCVVVLPKQWEY